MTSKSRHTDVIERLLKTNFRVAAPGGLVKGGAVQCSWVEERRLVFLLAIQFDDQQNKLVSFSNSAYAISAYANIACSNWIVIFSNIILDIPSESLLSTGRSASIAAPGASVPTSTMRKIKQMFNKDDQRLSSSSVNYGRVRTYIWSPLNLNMRYL